MPGSRTALPARRGRSRGVLGLRIRGAGAAVAWRIGPSPLTLSDELRLDQLGNDAGCVAAGEEFADGAASTLAEIERPIVDIHADKGVSLLLVETAAELQRIFQRRLPMGEAVLDAFLQQLIDVANRG